MCPRLSLACCYREEIPGSGDSHVMVESASSAQYASGSHGRLADTKRDGSQNPKRKHHRAPAQRHLQGPPDSIGGHEAGQDMASKDPKIVTEKISTYCKHRISF